MNTYKPNKYFVYEGDIVRAAQPHFNGAMRYFKEGFKMFFGKPLDKNKIDITKVSNKFLKLKSL